MANIIKPKKITVFIDEHNNEPFTSWLNKLRDTKSAHRIRSRIRRLEAGHYGDCSPVGEGVLELRMFFGAGYRVYFGEDQESIVVLLCGGDKDSQERDIKIAKQHWKEYKSHE